MNIRSHLIALATALSLALAAGMAHAGDPAPAQDQAPAQAPEAGQPSAEVKAAKGVENREPVEEGTSFAAGDKVFIWSRILNAQGATVEHVWKKDGKEIWKATLAVKSNRWTTHSRRRVSAGQYEVVVQTTDGTQLGSVSFTVQ